MSKRTVLELDLEVTPEVKVTLVIVPGKGVKRVLNADFNDDEQKYFFVNFIADGIEGIETTAYWDGQYVRDLLVDAGRKGIARLEQEISLECNLKPPKPA